MNIRSVCTCIWGRGLRAAVKGRDPKIAFQSSPLGVLPSSLLRPLPFSECILQAGCRNTFPNVLMLPQNRRESCGHVINEAGLGVSWEKLSHRRLKPPPPHKLCASFKWPSSEKGSSRAPTFSHGLQGGRPLMLRGFLAQFSYIRFVVGSNQDPACGAISSFMSLGSNKLFWEGLFGAFGMKLCLKPWAHAFHRWDFVKWTVMIYKSSYPSS